MRSGSEQASISTCPVLQPMENDIVLGSLALCQQRATSDIRANEIQKAQLKLLILRID